jgi:hypothetical protein
LKTKKYAANLAIAGAIISAALNAIKQLNRKEKDPSISMDWKELFASAGKGALAGALVGGVIGAIWDYENSSVEPQNTDAFLKEVIERIKLRPKDIHFQKLSQKADQLSELLNIQFGGKFSTLPMRGGSTTDGTALKARFDIDIYLSFLPYSFRSTRDMFDKLYFFLEKQVYSYGITEIRDQAKSIGVFYTLLVEKLIRSILFQKN